MRTAQFIRHCRLARNAVTVIAVPLLTLRVGQFFGAVHFTGVINFVTFVGFTLTFIAAIVLGWTTDAYQIANRTVVAEWESAVLRRTERQQKEYEDTEWANWWAEAREHDTIVFGPAVVSFDARRLSRHPKVG